MECKHHSICSLTDEFDPEEHLCILHSRQQHKDQKAFAEALAVHRKAKGDQFGYMAFPGEADFSEVTFTGAADFAGATFTELANFYAAAFTGHVSFHEATFTGHAAFMTATFTQGADFSGATFTGQPNFEEATFTGTANFLTATFLESAAFNKVTFTEEALFGGSTFTGWVNFEGATFAGWTTFAIAPFTGHAAFHWATFIQGAIFNGATFTQGADFGDATFTREANFHGATFTEGSWFNQTTFTQGADFGDATFLGENYFQRTRFEASTTFQRSRFSGRLLFTGGGEAQPDFLIFQDATTVDFRNQVIGSAENVSFRQADFRTCRFLNTDLRKAELTGVRWPQKGGRRVVYDEIAPISEEPYPWDELERLYRELKQNYEDRRNYARAGDFHYGEKEMQRRNPATPRSLKFFLWLYWGVSGYGERFLRPLGWALVLLIMATVAYLWLGLVPKGGGAPLQWANSKDWGLTIDYGLRVMTLLRPDDLVPVGYARYVHTLQNLLGPLFLGLFALAVRQRLKY